MARPYPSCLLAVGLLLASPLAAAPRIDITISGAVVDVTVTEATPAAALARLAEIAGFSVEGADSLPPTPISTHLRGPLDRVVASLTDPLSRIATYADGDPSHMIRLVLVSTGRNAGAVVASRPMMAGPDDLRPGDAAVGGSRIGPEALKSQLRNTLGLTIP